MIIDEPDLGNSERLGLAADALVRGEPAVHVWVERRGLETERAYRNWLAAVLRERHRCPDDAALVLAAGAVIHLEKETRE